MAGLFRSSLPRLQRLTIVDTPRNIYKMNMNSPDLPELFQPPVNRSMKTLDKSFFRKVIPLAAASVSDVKQITNVRRELEKSSDILKINPIKPLREDETTPGAKCFLLTPSIVANGMRSLLADSDLY